MEAQKFMGAQKLLMGHDASASLRGPQMAPVVTTASCANMAEPIELPLPRVGPGTMYYMGFWIPQRKSQFGVISHPIVNIGNIGCAVDILNIIR